MPRTEIHRKSFRLKVNKEKYRHTSYGQNFHTFDLENNSP